jgi:hypothetical protein
MPPVLLSSTVPRTTGFYSAPGSDRKATCVPPLLPAASIAGKIDSYTRAITGGRTRKTLSPQKAP